MIVDKKSETILIELRIPSSKPSASHIIALSNDGTHLWKSQKMPAWSIGSINSLSNGDVLLGAQPTCNNPEQGFIILEGNSGKFKFRTDIVHETGLAKSNEWIDKIFELENKVIIQTVNGNSVNNVYSLNVDGIVSKQFSGDREEYLVSVNRNEGSVITFDRKTNLMNIYK